MSGARILEFGSDFEFGNLDFQDLKKQLEKYLDRSNSYTDLEKLIGSLNPLLRDNKYTANERQFLKRFRQRAYDRRRSSKFQTSGAIQISRPDPSSKSEPTSQSESLNPRPSVATNVNSRKEKLKVLSAEETGSFNWSTGRNLIGGFKRAIAGVDGERLARSIPKAVLSLFGTLMATGLLWQQSLGLYDSAGFSQPSLVAVGSILMMIGFSGIYAGSKSKLALLLCLYAGVYETYFVISGTFEDELASRYEAASTNVEMIFLQDKADRTRASYLNAKSRYEDPASRVYKNEWYKKKHLNPAWADNEDANKDLMDKKAELLERAQTNHVTWLKVMYRLGLVFLCMMLVHRLVATFRTES
ncbi:MAG: hypothetical protein HYW48_09025 [Deltaproteobacteria bacterium]|nr:hypothetical protein [Deltaproteobacteria bacterium]